MTTDGVTGLSPTRVVMLIWRAAVGTIRLIRLLTSLGRVNHRNPIRVRAIFGRDGLTITLNAESNQNISAMRVRGCR
jgi:hypothetical protein